MRWKYHRTKELTLELCHERFDEGVNFIDEFVSSAELWSEALTESTRYDHSAYDLFYAVLARRHGATLITNDSGLVKICEKMRVECSY